MAPDGVSSSSRQIVRIVPIMLACGAALHLVHLVRVAVGFDHEVPYRLQNLAVLSVGKEFGLVGVALFGIIDVLVIIACIRSLREKP